MRSVTFHFLTADYGQPRGGEEARLAAAILHNCLSRQGYPSTLDGNKVTATVPQRRESDPEEIYLLLDETLLDSPEILTHLDHRSAVVVCSARPAKVLRHQLGRMTAGVAAVDACGIAMEEGADEVTALLGGAARMLPFIDPDVLCASVWNTFDREFPYAARAAMRAFDLGYMQTQQAIG